MRSLQLFRKSADGSPAFPGIDSQISSAVNGQIGESAIAIVSTSLQAAVCAERRTGSFGART